MPSIPRYGQYFKPNEASSTLTTIKFPIKFAPITSRISLWRIRFTNSTPILSTASFVPFFSPISDWYNNNLVEFQSAGFIIPRFNMGVIIGVNPSQINGEFRNPESAFQLDYSIHITNYCEELLFGKYRFLYFSHCYVSGCISNVRNIHRANYLGFCHDTKYQYFYPLSEPCYEYTGENTTVSEIDNLVKYYLVLVFFSAKRWLHCSWMLSKARRLCSGEFLWQRKRDRAHFESSLSLRK